MKNCIFCKIINKELPSKIVFENKDFIAFHDINPQAPLHILLLPKKHIPSLNHLKKEDGVLLKEIFFVIQKVVKKLKLDKKGYKVGLNVGRNAGQLVEHLHFHILGGWKKKGEIHKQKFP